MTNIDLSVLQLCRTQKNAATCYWAVGFLPVSTAHASPPHMDRGDALPLRDSVDAVKCCQLDGFPISTWPTNLQVVDCICVTQSEVNAEVIGGEIAAAAEHVAALTNASRGEIDSGAHRIARAFVAPR